MTPAAWGALGIAVFGAISYAAGSILQAIGARRSTGTVRTLGHPVYLLGVGFDILSWAGSMVALRELAVYQVQSVLAGSLAITVVMARVFLGSRVRRRDAFAVVITVAALAVLAMSAGPQEPVAASARLRIGFCAAAAATVLLGWIAAKFTPPGVVAGLSGLAFGGAALAGRALALPDHPTRHLAATGLAIVTEPLTAALLTFAAAGMLLYTHALQHGQVGPVTAVLWIGEVVAPSAVGLMLLGDTVLPGWDLRAGIAGCIVVASAVVLATAPGTSDTAQPAPAQQTQPSNVPPAAPSPAFATTVYPFLAGAARAHSASARYTPDGRPPSAPPRLHGRPFGPPARVSATYPVWPPPAYHEPTPEPGRQPTGNTVWWGPPSAQRPIYIPPVRPAPANDQPAPTYAARYAPGARYAPAPPPQYQPRHQPAPQPPPPIPAEVVPARPVSHWPLSPQAFLPQPTREQPGWV
jgi:hypothetical protein